jgi:hypothetical protein
VRGSAENRQWRGVGSRFLRFLLILMLPDHGNWREQAGAFSPTLAVKRAPAKDSFPWCDPVMIIGNFQLQRGLWPTLLHGSAAVAVLRHARNRPTRDGEWVHALLARKPTKVAAVALANKTARIIWAVMMRGDGYRAKEVFGQPA